jgi:hypothetical protein
MNTKPMNEIETTPKRPLNTIFPTPKIFEQTHQSQSSSPLLLLSLPLSFPQGPHGKRGMKERMLRRTFGLRDATYTTAGNTHQRKAVSPTSRQRERTPNTTSSGIPPSASWSPSGREGCELMAKSFDIFLSFFLFLFLSLLDFPRKTCLDYILAIFSMD